MKLPARILVVDDEAPLREAMAGLLRDEGYVVDEAPHGAVALEEALAHRPAVVLFDCLMPVWDGPTLVAALRETLRPPPVFVGVSASPASRLWCLEHGIPLFVAKPFDDVTLLRAIEDALSRAQERVPTISTPRPAKSACVLLVGERAGDAPIAAGDQLAELPVQLRDAHLRVVLADDAAEAERVLALVVPDLLMVADAPEHDRLRALAAGRGIPVVVRSASGSEHRLRLSASPAPHGRAGGLAG